MPSRRSGTWRPDSTTLTLPLSLSLRLRLSLSLSLSLSLTPAPTLTLALALALPRYEEALGLYGDALEAAACGPAVAEAGAEAEAAVAVAAALRSNRSACFAALTRFEPALAEAQQACELRPRWAKGHSRVGAALHGLGRLEEAAGTGTFNPNPSPSPNPSAHAQLA
eukprot:scaffold53452_cov42-Phaeocystis_antarctica.AAC.1